MFLLFTIYLIVYCKKGVCQSMTQPHFFMLTGRERLATIRYKRIWPVSISSKAMG